MLCYDSRGMTTAKELCGAKIKKADSNKGKIGAPQLL
jgi:hypothetical protein